MLINTNQQDKTNANGDYPDNRETSQTYLHFGNKYTLKKVQKNVEVLDD